MRLDVSKIIKNIFSSKKILYYKPIHDYLKHLLDFLKEKDYFYHNGIQYDESSSEYKGRLAIEDRDVALVRLYEEDNGFIFRFESEFSDNPFEFFIEDESDMSMIFESIEAAINVANIARVLSKYDIEWYRYSGDFTDNEIDVRIKFYANDDTLEDITITLDSFVYLGILFSEEQAKGKISRDKAAEMFYSYLEDLELHDHDEYVSQNFDYNDKYVARIIFAAEDSNIYCIDAVPCYCGTSGYKLFMYQPDIDEYENSFHVTMTDYIEPHRKSIWDKRQVSDKTIKSIKEKTGTDKFDFLLNSNQYYSMKLLDELISKLDIIKTEGI
jgi:hypothetical protein